MDKLAAFKLLAADAARGNLHFPTTATVLLRVRDGLADPDCSVDQATRLIQTDPLLSARIVATGNSIAFNRSGRAVTDVRAAINLLGFKMVRMLATAMVARQLAGTSDTPAIRTLATKLWEHSAHVAALAHLLAKRVTRQDADAALFAGMLHEIGGFYLLSRAKEFPGLLEGDARDWTNEIASGFTPEMALGQSVLKALQVPKPVQDAIDVVCLGYLAYPPATLGDTLLLADQLAPVRSPLFQSADKTMPELRGTIDLIVDQETLSEILKESAEHVRSLTDALRV